MSQPTQSLRYCPRHHLRYYARHHIIIALAIGTMLSCGGPSERDVEAPAVQRPLGPIALVAIPEPVAEGVIGPERYAVTDLPAGHGYGRGDMLAMYVPQPGTSDEEAVGFGYIIEARAHSLLFMAAHLDMAHQGESVRLGPLPSGHHFGKQLGQIVSMESETGRVRLDMGRDHGVVLGDLYNVLGDTVGAATAGCRSLGRAPVGLVQVVEVSDLHAVARIESGRALANAHVVHAGHDAGLHRQEPGVRVLVTRFLGADGEAFALKLDTVLRKAIRYRKDGDGQAAPVEDVTVGYHPEPIAEADAGHDRARALGRSYGYDIVVWGSVRTAGDQSSVVARVAFTNPERLDTPGRDWGREKLALESLLDDDGDAVSRRVHSLAAYLAGLSYYIDHQDQNGGWARAAYHLRQVGEAGEPGDARQARQMLFYCYQRSGEWALAETTARQVAEDGRNTGDARTQAHGLYMQAVLAKQSGRLDQAVVLARRSAAVNRQQGDERNVAVATGIIADVAFLRGQYEEALRILRQEELPVYEKLGATRMIAVTQGRIADIYYKRGQYDEALRIRRQEVLPVYEKLGDIRLRALTQGKIADIYYQRGQYDEALRIRRQEQLPVYEKLGDIRGHAVTQGKIADIYYQRGQYDEALRILHQEVLPVFEKLGDIRGHAVTQGKIANIYWVQILSDQTPILQIGE